MKGLFVKKHYLNNNFACPSAVLEYVGEEGESLIRISFMQANKDKLSIVRLFLKNFSLTALKGFIGSHTTHGWLCVHIHHKQLADGNQLGDLDAWQSLSSFVGQRWLDEQTSHFYRHADKNSHAVIDDRDDLDSNLIISKTVAKQSDKGESKIVLKIGDIRDDASHHQLNQSIICERKKGNAIAFRVIVPRSKKLLVRP